MTKNIAAIINPASGFGKTKKLMKQVVGEIKAQNSAVRIVETYHPLHAIALTKELLKSGKDRIIVVGGDGTLNEVVNGFFDSQGKLLNPQASLGVVPSGSGSDFVRSLSPKTDLVKNIHNALNLEARPTDIGVVEAHDANGRPQSRHFINVSSFGLSGLVAGFMRSINRNLGPTAAYFMSTVKAIKAFNAREIIIENENKKESIVKNCSLVSFANGKYYGSGMKIAPKAELDDGLLDQISINDLSLMFFLLNGYRVYQGTHLDLPNVSMKQTKLAYVRAVGNEPVYIETDGELFAQLPAKYWVKKQAMLVAR